MFYIKPKREYCRKHGIEYSGYICPECRVEMERKSHSGTIPEAKHNAKPKKKEINIEDFPISDEVLEKANQLGGKKLKPKSKGEKIKPPSFANLGNLHKKGEYSKDDSNEKPGKAKEESGNPFTPSKAPRSVKVSTPLFHIPNWLFALLLIFALSILGLGFNALTGSSIPLWILLGFSILYPIEKWFKKVTLNKPVGKFYRLVLNLVVLSTLGLLIWSGFQLGSNQLGFTPLMSSVIFLAELVFFIWMWRKVAKNSWRWPSMKLTMFALVCIAIIFTFAGVQPFAGYKDDLLGKWEVYQAEQAVKRAEREAEEEVERIEEERLLAIEEKAKQEEIERAEAARLKAEEEALRGGSEDANLSVSLDDGKPSGAVNVKPEPEKSEPDNGAVGIASLRNPSWKELKAFLLEENTDEIEYVYPEMICADFANRVQSNAKIAGWRCAVVSMRLTGYDDPFNFGIPSDSGHAVNAFETIDRGLVYIDCTGWVNGVGPIPADRLAVLEIGKRQRNTFIFPTDSECVDNVSIIQSIDISW